MKRILFLLIAVVTLCLCFAAVNAEMKPAASNGQLELYVDEDTLEMKVVDLVGNKEYFTKVMNGSSGNKTTKNNEKSDIRAEYIVNKFVGTTNSMDSYSMSVGYKNFELEYLENGVEIRYEIGDMTISVEDLPKMIPVDKYKEKLLPYWTEKDDESFREFYRIVRETQWVRTDDGTIGKMKLENLYQLLYSKGVYTKEDLTADNAAYGYEISKVNPRIHVTVRFLLDGSDLVVSVPCGDISFTEANPVTRIDLLPYFMTATQQDEGYIFVPDGCGSLIYLNNGRITALSYTDRVYGSDVLMNTQTYSAPSDAIRLPVYGIKTQDSAVMAIIEEGAEIASVYADIAGRSDEFNRVYSYFTIRDIEFVSSLGTASGSSPRYPDDIYTGNITVRYRFLYGEDANYVGMAHSYREYLLENGLLAENELPQTAPFFAELIGAVRQTKFFAGIPYKSTAVATTMEQGTKIVKALKEKGVRNICLMLNGYFEGGVKHESLANISLESSTGSKKQLKQLKKAVRETDGTLVFMMNAEKVYTGDDFRQSTQASRRQDNFIASVVTYAEPILNEERGYTDSFYVSPLYLKEYAGKVSSELKQLSADGIAVEDLGGLLVGDYRNNNNVSRIHATDGAVEALQTLGKGRTMLLNSPNLYALRFADAVYALPSSSNGHKVEDEDVPFIQLVLDGSCVYTTTPWNASAYTGIWREVNYAMETRSAPYFRLTYESEQIFLHTEDMDSQNYFMTKYTTWLDEISESYSEYSRLWNMTADAHISAHDILYSGLRRVTYDNGVRVYVNYLSADAEADGLTVPARGYLIVPAQDEQANGGAAE